MDLSSRLFVVDIESLGVGELLFHSLSGTEALSDLYEFEVTLLHPHNNLDIAALLGKSLTLEIRDIPASSRYLNGKITRMALSGREAGGNRHYIYRALVRPGLWYLTQSSDCRIFQEKSVPEILAQVLGEYRIGFVNRLSAGYRVWNYCVQYQETDFAFVSRLMEHEGIYYYFTHQQGEHVLVLADAPQGHDALPGYASIDYRLAEGGAVDLRACIREWTVAASIHSSQVSLDDYNYLKPRARLLSVGQNPASHAQDKARLFEWPGVYTERDQGDFYVRVRQQALEARHASMHGSASSLGPAPGRVFQLQGAPRQADDQQYLVHRARYFFQENSYASNSEDRPEHRIDFDAIPATVNWRPQRLTPWPKTSGPQTAEVVGPEGESIWTDQYGRVKLRFHWDRYAAGDDTSSCWVRVSSGWWAGWKYGAVQVPRVGEEVIVDFVNGDPDRPLITGRVYNEDNMPPWDLPAQATRMGIVSRSKDGTAQNASFFCLDDTRGVERFDMHAERDMNISVENDQNISVENDQNTTVAHDQNTNVLNDVNIKITNNMTIVLGG
ncbi:type VI secretion system secreted protein VgrG [Pseudomonas delhiensis]|uniref:Type VI secretion system secreted protein VgrG n=1 Tax=Pseudomonas delhiensis TaxID=366289 RepID=A0A239IB40_9PSED|nr:type VI secretion system tip protein TssI/VgrG [Pseudomonas delhiensis]SDK15667.1 type VI secretion system secreted protein VgrG [Pseudomonas delhiensis]SNS90632.1 type VI secretion system secreted protein VgrG [Pseudomonas delhiensis]